MTEVETTWAPVSNSTCTYPYHQFGSRDANLGHQAMLPSELALVVQTMGSLSNGKPPSSHLLCTALMSLAIPSGNGRKSEECVSHRMWHANIFHGHSCFPRVTIPRPTADRPRPYRVGTPASVLSQAQAVCTNLRTGGTSSSDPDRLHSTVDLGLGSSGKLSWSTSAVLWAIGSGRRHATSSRSGIGGIVGCIGRRRNEYRTHIIST